MEDTSRITVTEQEAYFSLPSFAVVFIVAVPLETAVTLPAASTVATLGSLEVHVNDSSLALLGETVAISVSNAPSFRDNEDLFNCIPVTCCLTSTSQVAITPLASIALAVIVALPGDLPVTTPLEDTVAMFLSELDHVILL